MELKKNIAILTTICFLISCVLNQAVYAAVELRRDTGQFKQMLDDFAIPASLGHISKARFYDSGKVVVNIQDLHCHPEVQRNISRLIGLLDRKYQLKNVYVEGASGNVSTAWLTDIADAKSRNEIVEALVDQGKLTGSEYYSVTQRRPDLLRGMEDEGPYDQNIVRLGKILEKKEYFAQKTAALGEDLSAMQLRYFNRQNRNFDRLVNEHRQGQISTEKYYRILEKYVETINDHPEKYDNVFVIDKSKYANLRGYLELVDAGKKLHYRNVARQLQQFVSVLKQKLPYSAYNYLLERTDNFTNLDELYVYLARINREYRLDTARSFPDLTAFFSFIEKGQALNPVLLVKEERKLVEQIRLGLAQDKNELEVSFLSDFYLYFADYLNNRLSADDYEYFTGQFDQFKTLWDKYAFRNRLTELQGDFALLDDFYRVNVSRNDYFMKNMLGDYRNSGTPAPAQGLGDNIRRTVESLGKADEILVVVAGGFHTEGLEKLLDERQISYLDITPNVTRDTKRSDEVYIEIAKQQAKILSQAIALKMLSTLTDSEKDRTLRNALAATVAAHLKDANIDDPAVQRRLQKILNDRGMRADSLKVSDGRLTISSRDGETTVDLADRNSEGILSAIRDGRSAWNKGMPEAARLAVHELVKQVKAVETADMDVFSPGTPYAFLKAVGLTDAAIQYYEENGLSKGQIYEIYTQAKASYDGVPRGEMGLLPSKMQKIILTHAQSEEAVALRASENEFLAALFTLEFIRDIAVAMDAGDHAREEGQQTEEGLPPAGIAGTRGQAPAGNGRALTIDSTYEVVRDFVALFGWKNISDRTIEVFFAPVWEIVFTANPFRFFKKHTGRDLTREDVLTLKGIWKDPRGLLTVILTASFYVSVALLLDWDPLIIMAGSLHVGAHFLYSLVYPLFDWEPLTLGKRKEDRAVNTLSFNVAGKLEAMKFVKRYGESINFDHDPREDEDELAQVRPVVEAHAREQGIQDNVIEAMLGYLEIKYWGKKDVFLAVRKEPGKNTPSKKNGRKKKKLPAAEGTESKAELKEIGVAAENAEQIEEPKDAALKFVNMKQGRMFVNLSKLNTLGAYGYLKEIVKNYAETIEQPQWTDAILRYIDTGLERGRKWPRMYLAFNGTGERKDTEVPAGDKKKPESKKLEAELRDEETLLSDIASGFFNYVLQQKGGRQNTNLSVFSIDENINERLKSDLVKYLKSDSSLLSEKERGYLASISEEGREGIASDLIALGIVKTDYSYKHVSASFGKMKYGYDLEISQMDGSTRHTGYLAEIRSNRRESTGRRLMLPGIAEWMDELAERYPKVPGLVWEAFAATIEYLPLTFMPWLFLEAHYEDSYILRDMLIGPWDSKVDSLFFKGVTPDRLQGLHEKAVSLLEDKLPAEEAGIGDLRLLARETALMVRLQGAPREPDDRYLLAAAVHEYQSRRESGRAERTAGIIALLLATWGSFAGLGVMGAPFLVTVFTAYGVQLGGHLLYNRLFPDKKLTIGTGTGDEPAGSILSAEDKIRAWRFAKKQRPVHVKPEEIEDNRTFIIKKILGSGKVSEDQAERMAQYLGLSYIEYEKPDLRVKIVMMTPDKQAFKETLSKQGNQDGHAATGGTGFDAKVQAAFFVEKQKNIAERDAGKLKDPDTLIVKTILSFKRRRYSIEQAEEMAQYIGVTVQHYFLLYTVKFYLKPDITQEEKRQEGTVIVQQEEVAPPVEAQPVEVAAAAVKERKPRKPKAVTAGIAQEVKKARRIKGDGKTIKLQDTGNDEQGRTEIPEQQRTIILPREEAAPSLEEQREETAPAAKERKRSKAIKITRRDIPEETAVVIKLQHKKASVKAGRPEKDAVNTEKERKEGSSVQTVPGKKEAEQKEAAPSLKKQRKVPAKKTAAVKRNLRKEEDDSKAAFSYPWMKAKELKNNVLPQSQSLVEYIRKELGVSRKDAEVISLYLKENYFYRQGHRYTFIKLDDEMIPEAEVAAEKERELQEVNGVLRSIPRREINTRIALEFFAYILDAKGVKDYYAVLPEGGSAEDRFRSDLEKYLENRPEVPAADRRDIAQAIIADKVISTEYKYSLGIPYYDLKVRITAPGGRSSFTSLTRYLAVGLAVSAGNAPLRLESSEERVEKLKREHPLLAQWVPGLLWEVYIGYIEFAPMRDDPDGFLDAHDAYEPVEKMLPHQLLPLVGDRTRWGEPVRWEELPQDKQELFLRSGRGFVDDLRKLIDGDNIEAAGKAVEEALADGWQLDASLENEGGAGTAEIRKTVAQLAGEIQMGWTGLLRAYYAGGTEVPGMDRDLGDFAAVDQEAALTILKFMIEDYVTVKAQRKAKIEDILEAAVFGFAAAYLLMTIPFKDKAVAAVMHGEILTIAVGIALLVAALPVAYFAGKLYGAVVHAVYNPKNPNAHLTLTDRAGLKKEIEKVLELMGYFFMDRPARRDQAMKEIALAVQQEFAAAPAVSGDLKAAVDKRLERHLRVRGMFIPGEKVADVKDFYREGYLQVDPAAPEPAQRVLALKGAPEVKDKPNRFRIAIEFYYRILSEKGSKGMEYARPMPGGREEAEKQLLMDLQEHLRKTRPQIVSFQDRVRLARQMIDEGVIGISENGQHYDLWVKTTVYDRSGSASSPAENENYVTPYAGTEPEAAPQTAAGGQNGPAGKRKAAAADRAQKQEEGVTALPGAFDPFKELMSLIMMLVSRAWNRHDGGAARIVYVAGAENRDAAFTMAAQTNGRTDRVSGATYESLVITPLLEGEKVPSEPAEINRVEIELPGAEGRVPVSVWEDTVDNVKRWYVRVESDRQDVVSPDDLASIVAEAIVRELDADRDRVGLVIDHNPSFDRNGIVLWKNSDKVVSRAAIDATGAVQADPVRVVGNLRAIQRAETLARVRETIVDIGKIREDADGAEIADFLKIENGTILIDGRNFVNGNGAISDKKLKALAAIVRLAHHPAPGQDKGIKVYFRYPVNASTDIRAIVATLTDTGVDNVYLDFTAEVLHINDVTDKLGRIPASAAVTVHLHPTVDGRIDKAAIAGRKNVKFVKEIRLSKDTPVDAIRQMAGGLQEYETAEVFFTVRDYTRKDEISPGQLKALAAAPSSSAIIFHLDELKDVIERQRNSIVGYSLMDILREFHIDSGRDPAAYEENVAARLDRRYLSQVAGKDLVRALQGEFSMGKVKALLADIDPAAASAIHLKKLADGYAAAAGDGQAYLDAVKAYLRTLAARTLAKEELDRREKPLGLADAGLETVLGQAELYNALHGPEPVELTDGAEQEAAKELYARAEKMVQRLKADDDTLMLPEIMALIRDLRENIVEIEQDPAGAIRRTPQKDAALNGLLELLPLLDSRLPQELIKKENGKPLDARTVAAILRAA